MGESCCLFKPPIIICCFTDSSPNGCCSFSFSLVGLVSYRVVSSPARPSSKSIRSVFISPSRPGIPPLSLVLIHFRIVCSQLLPFAAVFAVLDYLLSIAPFRGSIHRTITPHTDLPPIYTMSSLPPVYIVASARTPVGSFLG